MLSFTTNPYLNVSNYTMLLCFFQHSRHFPKILMQDTSSCFLVSHHNRFENTRLIPKPLLKVISNPSIRVSDMIRYHHLALIIPQLHQHQQPYSLRNMIVMIIKHLHQTHQPLNRITHHIHHSLYYYLLPLPITTLLQMVWLNNS